MDNFENLNLPLFFFNIFLFFTHFQLGSRIVFKSIEKQTLNILFQL